MNITEFAMFKKMAGKGGDAPALLHESSIVIGANGTFVETPNAGYDGLSRVTITVDVPQQTQTIFDINGFPTLDNPFIEEIDTQGIGRLKEGIYAYQPMVKTKIQEGATHIVDELPEIGEPCTLDGVEINSVYYKRADRTVYAYVSDEIAPVLGAAVGWYDAKTLLSALGYSYGGVVTSLGDMTELGTLYFLANKSYLIYTDDEWVELTPDDGNDYPIYDVTPTPSLVYTLSSDESYYIVGTGFTSIEAIEADIGGGTEGSGLDSSWQGGRVVIPSEYNGKPVLAVAPRAFAGFYDITQVYVHDGITHFGHRSFQCPNSPWDTAMTSCRLPNTLVWMGGEDGRVFYGRQGLTSIHIPPNVSELTRAVFAYCNSITAAYTNNVKKLVRSCFQDCSSLTTLNTDNMEEIGDVSFYNCTNLKEINLPKVEIIGNNVFHNTNSLTKVTIGQNCRSIDASGLRCGSTSNKCTFYFEGTTPPTIQSTTFDETTLNKIIVPKGCGNTYKTATNWVNFASYIEEAV